MPTLEKETAEYSREDLAQYILDRFDASTIQTCQQQLDDSTTIQLFFVDDLLPESVAQLIYQSFPDADKLRERKTIREHKFVTSQMDKHAPQLEEALFAFHNPRIVELISNITPLQELEADPELYAGGINIEATQRKRLFQSTEFPRPARRNNQGLRLACRHDDS